MKAVKDGFKTGLSKAGAFIRQRAKTSIRKRKQTAKPGSPPSSHRGTLRDLILFQYDENTESVVIGPQLFGSHTTPTVPNLLEFGGEVNGAGKTIYVTNEVGRDANGKFVSGGKKKIEISGKLKFHQFPFMQPALDAEMDNFPGLFEGVVRG